MNLALKVCLFLILILVFTSPEQATNAIIPSHYQAIIDSYKPPIIVTYEKKVRVTWYNPHDPLQTDDSPGIMAFNEEYIPGDKVVAISRDLEKKYGWWNGTEFEIKGMGTFRVADRMHARKRNQVDVATPSKEEALKNGVQTRIITWTKVIAEPMELEPEILKVKKG